MILSSVSRGLAAIAVLLLATVGSARAQAGAGFAGPDAVPPRPPAVDIDPVWRGPSMDTLATVRKRGVLRVGVAVNEPMVMHDAQGTLVGFSVDVAQRLADDLGVTLELVETSWTQVIPDLLERRFDLIGSGLWVTPARALVINFSRPVTTEGIYLIAGRSVAGRFRTLADVDRPEVTVVSYAGTVQQRAAARLFPNARQREVAGEEDHLAPVLSGEAQAVLVPTLAPQRLIDGAPDRLALPLAAPLVSTATAFGVRKGDPDFLNYLDTWLRFQQDQGWLDERARHWADTTR